MADNIEPISHLEKVITGNAEPISHLEQVIALYGGTGGSGGSGTTNYNVLLNKPSINGVELSGNKTLADLGITNYDDAQNLEYEGESATCNNTLASRTSDMLIKGKTNQNDSKIESAGEKENKISILSKNKESADDNNYKQDKKEILLPIDGGLKCLPNGVADTIEQRNDEVYLVQRVGKVVLNGSEAWTKSSWSMTNTFKFDFEIGLVAKSFDINATNQILCDTFKVVSRNSLDNVANREFESICPSNSKSRTLSITVSKTKLNNANTTDTFKQWLRNNPVTVCYELETPIETKLDINNLDLEVYKDTTYITTDNAIQPTLKFKVPSNLGGVIQDNAQNINKLYKLSDEGVKKTDIVDNLTSTNTDKPLSAKQGKVLKGEVDLKANKTEVVKKTDITTTINSTSTATQVPSAKSVYDNAIKDKNIKTYTNVSQLGLTYPITVGEIFNAMPANSMAHLMADTGSKITDCPSANGILIIDKCYMSKFSIEFKISASGESATNTLYIGQLKGTDGSGLKWQRVCTTSVADTSLKKLTNSSDIKSDADITYMVKNGVCNVSINTLSSTKMSTGNITLTTGLPIPANTSCWYSLCTNSNTTNASLQNLLLRIDSSGNLIAYKGTDNINYFGSFTYPVKES